MWSLCSSADPQLKLTLSPHTETEHLPLECKVLLSIVPHFHQNAAGTTKPNTLLVPYPRSLKIPFPGLRE